MALNRIQKNMIDQDFVKQVDDQAEQLAQNETQIESLDTSKVDKIEMETELTKKQDKTTPLLLEDLHTEVKTAMTGGSVAVVGEDMVGEENLKSGSVTYDKLKEITIIKGKNLFNKDNPNNTDGHYVSNNSGILVENVDYITSDYIEVQPNENYYLSSDNANGKFYAFYDIDKVFIEGGSSSTYEVSILSPSNAYHLRVAHRYDSLETFMIEENTVRTSYETYQPPKFVHDRILVKSKNLDDNSIGNEKIIEVDLTKITGTSIVNSKNLFDKSNVVEGSYVIYGTGGIGSNADYFATYFIPVDATKTYVFSGDNANSKYYAFYDNAQVFIIDSGVSASGNEIIINPPTNAVYLRISARIEALDTYQLEVGTTATEYEPYWENKAVISNLLLESQNFREKQIEEKHLAFELPQSNKRIYDLSDAFYQWKVGNKFPVAFLGDSTTDGTSTTGHTDNVIGTDHQPPNAYPTILERKLRDAFNNTQLRIYNAGFAGSNAIFGNANIDEIFAPTSPYADVKMIGLSHGINDRHGYGNTELELANGFRSETVKLIDWCYANNIQPFLVTPQAILQYMYDSNYPIDSARTNTTVITSVLKELAKEYNLELVDKQYFTERFLNYSHYDFATIISDSLHFGDVGHVYEADMFFALLNKETIWINQPDKITPTNNRLYGNYYMQNITKITENNGFVYKLSRNYTVDTLVMSGHVFINSDRPLTVTAHSETITNMYAIIDGVTIPLDSLEKAFGTWDLGLHEFEIYSGVSNVQFLGLKFS